MTVEAPPKDHGGLVRHLFFFIAFVPLLSWNFFTMLTGYWMFKFRDPQPAADQVQTDPDSQLNITSSAIIHSSLDDVKNALQVDFTSYMVITCMIPTVTVPFINAAVGHRFKTTPRLIVSLVVLTALLSFHLAMASIDTDGWQRIFLFVTLFTVFLFGTFIAVFISGFTGIAGCFPRDYMIALLRGQSLCAVFSAMANIVLLTVNTDDLSVAFYCFSLTILLHLAAFFALAGVTKTAFYKHHAAGPAPTQEEEQPLLGPATDPHPIKLTSVAWNIRVEMVTIFLLYMITMACHPGLTVLIEATGLHNGSATSWEKVYFVPVNCFLCFTVGNFLGRVVMPHLPVPTPTLALLLTLLRVLALPLFLVCNLVPHKRFFTPILIHSDVAYIVLMLIFSISTGILTSVSMVGVKARVKKEEQQAATNIMVGVRGLGLVIGSAISVLMVQLL